MARRLWTLLTGFTIPSVRGSDAFIGLLAGVAGVAGSFAATGYTPLFVGSPVERMLSRSMPGIVVSFAIENLGGLGQQLNLLFAIAIVILCLGTVATVTLSLSRRLENRAVAPIVTTLGSWLIVLAVTGDPVTAVVPGLATGGVLAGAVMSDSLLPATISPTAPARRRVLGSTAVAFLTAGVGTLFGQRRTPAAGGTLSVGNATQRRRLLGGADQRSLEIGGLEGLVSDGFYEVDINAVNPTVDAEEWTVSVTGAVEEELTFTLEELQNRAIVERFVTLRCVGERLNGKKMDTALWTGVPVAPLIAEASPRSGCECVMLRAADDYFEEFPLSALDDGMLAYGMNGDVLPRGHGHPVRALVPGHWGEVNVKWLTEIEILDQAADGYWEQRGWQGTGPVNTVAKIHAVNKRAGGHVEIGGHAYAGIRGIERVEVSTDGGDNWTNTMISEPPPQPARDVTPKGFPPVARTDVWRQWQHEYDHPGGSHQVIARAIDGTGTLQPRRQSEAFPSGATGWVSKRVE